MKMTRRQATAAAIATAIAIPAEGLRQYSYYDPPGILTVCYGSTTDVQKGKHYTLAECKMRLDADMRKAVTQVDYCTNSRLPEKVLAAFSDAAYNIGPKIACDTKVSTAARLLMDGAYRQACEQLPRWNKAKIAGVSVALPGLTKRRAEEMRICLQGV
jgi:GH24 family phage-related lysozyme (muramidase)